MIAYDYHSTFWCKYFSSIAKQIFQGVRRQRRQPRRRGQRNVVWISRRKTSTSSIAPWLGRSLCPAAVLNVAVTARAAVIDTVHAPVPVHAPLQPENVEPLAAAAVNVTEAPLA